MGLAPFLSTPLYQRWLWGGRNLAGILRRELPPDGPVAESWEVSDVEGSSTLVETGPYAGLALREVVRREGEALLGSRAEGMPGQERRFPLLVKYLDAQEVLSIQVHPDDEYAGRYGNGSPGKTEMWYIVAAGEGSEVIAGLRPGIGREQVREAVREGRLPELVRRQPVSAGEVVLMPAGRLHSLGRGIVALEIQQTSNLTYRLYDWGRVGPDGRPRPLHAEQSLAVIDFADADEPKLVAVVRREIWGKRLLLAVTPYFLTEAWDTQGSFDRSQALRAQTTGFSPEVLMVVSGSARVAWEGGALDLPHGRTAVVPARLGRYLVELREPSLLIRSRVPDLDRGLGEWSPTGEDEGKRIRAVCDRRAASRLFHG